MALNISTSCLPLCHVIVGKLLPFAHIPLWHELINTSGDKHKHKVLV